MSIIHRIIIGIIVFLTILLCSIWARSEETITLQGKVKAAITNTELLDAIVLTYDAKGNVKDSIRCDQGITFMNGEMFRNSVFYFDVPRRDSIISFDVVCDGYEPQTVTYTLSKINKREQYRQIPIVFMQRQLKRNLNEVTVTASKIKFYNRGDTIVYNADAFNLAEGSMLDGLIAQLPGVELSDDGQIKVNGQFVESLLLNGKEFFDGDNNLMLENIAAYTVKNVEVYKGHSLQEKYMGNTSGKPEHLTMDVKLKREYMMGWIVNAQGGYGTKDRYIGRIFASWFNPTTQLSFIGNSNNLNDNREPGKKDTWTPDKMPEGLRENNLAGLNYNYTKHDETIRSGGNFTFRYRKVNVQTTTTQTNFLPDGDTYDYSWLERKYRETNMRLKHTIYFRPKNISYYLGVQGEYSHNRNNRSSLSGTFHNEYADLNRDALEAIYTTVTKPGLLEDILNRSSYRNSGWNKALKGGLTPGVGIKLPTGDYLDFSAKLLYDSKKEEIWDGRVINFGNNLVPADALRQFTDNKPNHTFEAGGDVYYRAEIKDWSLSADYEFTYQNRVRDSYMYALDRLQDMGVFGELPENYLSTFDPTNSYRSNQKQFQNNFNVGVHYSRSINNSLIFFRISPTLSLIKRNLSYWTNNQDYCISHTNFNARFAASHDCILQYHTSKKGEKESTTYEHSFAYHYNLRNQLPELTDMIDETNTADPLNLYHGNPNLKPMHTHINGLEWDYTPYQKPFNNHLGVEYTIISSSLTRGYCYDTTTGVRDYSTYNVDGNKVLNIDDQIGWQFGNTKQFSLNFTGKVDLSWLSDMIGINSNAPEQQKVRNRNIGEKMTLAWQLGRQTLQLRCDYTNRHTTSEGSNFADINADHVVYGLTGNFKLPAGFALNTDFMCYTRRGYGLAELDTTDPIWNMRLSYTPPRNKRWVIMADGFDLLHRLSNVKYAVTATGRTVTYTNTQPRYFLLSVQYRLNLQPKKK